MSRRWRPSLGLVLGGALAGTLGITYCGLIVFRYLGADIGFRNAAYLMYPVIAGLTAVLGYVLVRLLLRPITALQAYATTLRDETTADVAPPAHFGTSELHRTARAVIDMAETLKDREATIRSFTDHVTHEIKTPVSAIQAAVELLDDRDTLAPEDRALLAQIDGARAQIQAQLEAMRRAATSRETRYVGTTQLNSIADNLAHLAPKLSVHLKGGDTNIPLSDAGLEMILGQLLGNATEHGAQEVTITAAHTPTLVTMQVADDGTGISQGNAARIFDPFFTTKRETGGTGMGLSIARNIVHLHKGQIAFIPAHTGATFEFSLPRPPKT